MYKIKILLTEDDENLGSKFIEKEVPEELRELCEEWREKLVETVCESDDDLLERFLEDRESISVDEFLEATRKATIALKIVPVYCGAALRNKGIQKLIDGIVTLLPSPLDKGAVSGYNPFIKKEAERSPAA